MNEVVMFILQVFNCTRTSFSFCQVLEVVSTFEVMLT